MHHSGPRRSCAHRARLCTNPHAQLPRATALKVRKHFKYYYSQRPPFDEVELLNDCPPALRSEVTQFVLRETLAKVVLFKVRA